MTISERYETLFTQYDTFRLIYSEVEECVIIIITFLDDHRTSCFICFPSRSTQTSTIA